jgi:hypothetical protein
MATVIISPKAALLFLRRPLAPDLNSPEEAENSTAGERFDETVR